MQSNTAGQHSAGVVSAAPEWFCEAKTRAGPASVAGHDSGKSRVCTCEANGPPIFATGKLRACKRRVNHRGEARYLPPLPAANAIWLSLPLKLSRLKTVHRTVFFTASALPGSNPSIISKRKIPITKVMGIFPGGD